MLPYLIFGGSYLKNLKKSHIIAVVILLFIVWVGIDSYYSEKNEPEHVNYTQFVKDLKAGKIDTVYYNTQREYMRYTLLNKDTKKMSYKERKKYKYDNKYWRMTEYPSYDNFRRDVLLTDTCVVLRTFDPVSTTVLTLVGTLAIPVLFVVMLFGIYKSSLGGALSRRKRGDFIQTSNVKFDNVIGHDELKDDLQFIVKMLKNPKLGSKTGARLPKGILFSGSPGTGKTLLAKAIAGEANVPFLYADASAFVEMYVGLGAKRVRELFDIAKKNTPCIIFIDEIDAIGGKRRESGGTTEHDQTLNALLQEMDGFSTQSGIFVIGATNTPDKLDKALIRSGRFDRKVEVNPPKDWRVRKQIFEYYLRGKKLSESADLGVVSKQTVGFTGADIEAVVNEASIISAMRDSDTIGMEDIESAVDKQIFKGNRSKDKRESNDRVVVAYHEAGHAVVSYLLGIKLARASIIGTTSGVGGAVFQQESDSQFKTNEDFINDIKVCYGGRASEEIKFKTITTGASSDITKATELLNGYIQRYGFDNDFGLLDMDVLKDNMLIEADTMLSKMSELSRKFYKDTVNLLSENYSLVEVLAKKLLEVETLSADNIYELLENN